MKVKKFYKNFHYITIDSTCYNPERCRRGFYNEDKEHLGLGIQRERYAREIEMSCSIVEASKWLPETACNSDNPGNYNLAGLANAKRESGFTDINNSNTTTSLVPLILSPGSIKPAWKNAQSQSWNPVVPHNNMKWAIG